MEMEATGLLSVIVPIYNVEQYLDRCLESIVSQTYRDLEIILVDDGSPDGCPAKCEEWAKRDSRIKVIHKQNGGLGYARNSGLEVATGEYVAFVDSDDWLAIEMYQELMQIAIKDNIDCVYCGFKRQMPTLEFVDEVDMGAETFRGSEVNKLAGRFLRNFSCKELHFSVWHGVYRRSLIDFKFVSERVCVSEDFVFTHEFLRRCRSFAYVPKALYYYAYNGGSLSRNYSEITFARSMATAKALNEIYRGTEYEYAGNAYAFCQTYFLMRFPVMNSKLPLKRKYEIFKHVICNDEYNAMLQDKSLFVFQKGIKYSIIKWVYHLHRNRCVLLNFLAILLISMKK